MQYKLKELATNFDYGMNSAAQDYDGQNKYLRITDINEHTRVYSTNDLKSPSGSLENRNNYLLSEGELVFARTGASVGKSYLYNKDDGKVYYAGYLIRIKVNDNNSPEFIFYNTLTARYNNFVQITSARSGQPGINAEEYKNYELKIPSYHEQQKIGQILKSLDKIITLEHQKKLAFINLKYALHQYFFGVTEKKWRLYFDEQQSKWRKVSFNEIIEKSFKGTVKVIQLEPGDTEYLDADRLNGGEPFYCNKEPNVNNNDILILWDGSKAGRIYSGFTGVLGSTLKSYILVGGVDSQYVYHYLKSNENLISHSYTTPNIPHVVKDFDKVFEILLPTYNEQIKVGRTLTYLDELINNLNQSILKYKSIKKLLLSNMFV